MTLKKEIRIEFSPEEKDIMYKAADVITEILDQIVKNKKEGNGDLPVVIPECYWFIYKQVVNIKKEIDTAGA